MTEPVMAVCDAYGPEFPAAAYFPPAEERHGLPGSFEPERPAELEAVIEDGTAVFAGDGVGARQLSEQGSVRHAGPPQAESAAAAGSCPAPGPDRKSVV